MNHDNGTVLDNKAMAEVLQCFSITATASVLSQSRPIGVWNCLLATHTPHFPTNSQINQTHFLSFHHLRFKKLKADFSGKADDSVKDTTEPHKKRAVSSTDGVVDEYPVKKRTPRKKQTDSGDPVPRTTRKKCVAPEKKDNGAAIKSEQDHEHGDIVEPVTPTRTKRDSANRKVTPSHTSSDSKSMSTSPSKPNDLTTKSTPRKRNAPKGGIADQRGIPNSWDEADDADKMMFTLKSQGVPWAVIREKWTAMTGIETAPR